MSNTHTIIMNVCNINIPTLNDIVNRNNTRVSLTAMARYKNPNDPANEVKNWFSNYSTIDFLKSWEEIMNPSFNGAGLGTIKKVIANGSSVTPTMWVRETNAIGITPPGRGRYAGDTFAHYMIATAFAEWLSGEFHALFIIKFYAMMDELNERFSPEHQLKRVETAGNYKYQTSAIQDCLIAPGMSGGEIRAIYAREGDRVNMAATGSTASNWRATVKPSHPDARNMRDTVDIDRLSAINMAQTLNGYLIRQGLDEDERSEILRRELVRNEAIHHKELRSGINTLMTIPVDD